MRAAAPWEHCFCRARARLRRQAAEERQRLERCPILPCQELGRLGIQLAERVDVRERVSLLREDEATFALEPLAARRPADSPGEPRSRVALD